MAIGSDPEIGATFTTGAMTDQQRVDWYKQMDSWGTDLLGGYGKLIFVTTPTWVP